MKAKASRVRAPELSGRAWLNTGGKQLSLRELRGKIVLLDFWAFCCINCLHVLDELRPLEEEFGDVLVTIGVHSPKFEHEADPAALRDAVERYCVEHPVLDDPELAMWEQYAVRAWPTLVIVDPEGYVVHVAAGEGHREALRATIAELIEIHEAKATLHRGDGPYVAGEPAQTLLRFPAKAIATANSTLLVSDSARHSIVELTEDGETVLRRIGTGQRGATDQPARFSEPAGLARLPQAVAEAVGYDVVVADTVNHLLRGLNTVTGDVSTIAGTGEQWRDGATDGQAREIALTSPWDVVWWEPAQAIAVAMAGNHTLGLFDPRANTVARLAGTTVEGLKDGPALEAFFAQPSGLASDGDRLWIADSETSALRYLDADRVVHTVVGEGLFDFGHRDGPAGQALLQHPLGVAVLGDGSVAIADTYNGALRRFDPRSNEVSTLANDLAEPSDVLELDGEVVVVASGAHRLERPVAPGVAAALVQGAAHRVKRSSTPISPGEFALDVVFTAPKGQKLDTRYGPSTRVEITSSPPQLLLEGAGVSTDLQRSLVVNPEVESGVLHVVAQAASCDDDPAIEHPACRLIRQDWGVPVIVSESGAHRLPLMLGGMDEHAG